MISPEVKVRIKTENGIKLKKELRESEEVERYSYGRGNPRIVPQNIKSLTEDLRSFESIKDFVIEKQIDEKLNKLREIRKERGEPEHEVVGEDFMCNRLMMVIDKEEAGERCPFCNFPTPVIEVKKE